MNLTTSIAATGIVIPDIYTEPVFKETVVVDFDAAEYKTQRELQNRKGSKGRQVKTTEQGFHVYTDSQDALSEHFLLKARDGVESHDAVPSMTVAVVNGEKYLIGGHHRAAGLVLAREKAIKEDYQKMFSAEGIDLASHLEKISIDLWECKNEYELRILADRENCEAQHGERNTPQERRSMIEDILKDPYKRQFSDMAVAIKFLNYSKGRGIIQRIRAEMVKKELIDKVEKTIDVNGTPRKASRPGSHSIELLNSNTTKLENAMIAYTELSNNATLVTVGEAAGAWKDAWKKAVQFLNDDEKTEMTTWLAELYADVEDVESPLAQKVEDAEPVTEEKPVDAKTKTVKSDAKSDDADNTVDESDDDNKAVISEIEAAASGIGTTEPTETAEPVAKTRSQKVENLMNTLADAVSITMELELNQEYVEILENLIGKVSQELDHKEDTDDK